MIGRLDRYVGRTLLGSYAATLLFVVFVFVVFDLLLRMSNYLSVAEERGISLLAVLGMWARYHLMGLPLIFVTVAPFVSVIASMFAISRLMASNEIGPMIFTGRSSARVLAPALVLAMLSGLAMVGCWELVLPPLSAPLERLSTQLDKGQAEGIRNIGLWSRDRRQTLMCRRYVPERQRMEGIVMLDRGSRTGDLAEVRARAGVWDAEHHDWELIDGHRRSGTSDEAQAWLGLEGLTPDAVWLSGKEATMGALLSFSELTSLIELSPGRADLVISYQYRLTWSLANVVLLLLSLPFAVQFERGNKVGRVILAIAICGGYLVLDLTCQNLGRQGWLHPLVAAWTPAILFGSLGIVMFGGMRT